MSRVCYSSLCLLPPAAGARSQARPGISLSALCIWSRLCIKYYLCGAQLCDKTYLRMDGGRVRERGERVFYHRAVKTCIGTVGTWLEAQARQAELNKNEDNHFWQRSCLAQV